MVKISNKRLKKLRQAQSESSQKQHYRMYKVKKNWVTAGVVTAALFGGFGIANSSVHADNVSPDVVNVQKDNTSTGTTSGETTPDNKDATKVVASTTNDKSNETATSTTQTVQQPSAQPSASVTTNTQPTPTTSPNQETTTSNPTTTVTDDVTPKTDTTSANNQTEQPKTTSPTNTLAVSRVATPEAPAPQTGDSNPNMDLHQTTAGKTYTTPEYVAKKSSIEAYIDNPRDFDNGVTKDLSYSSSTNFNVKGDFTIDGSLVKKDRTILLGTIVTSNNFYNDPWVKNHDQNIRLDHNAPQTITYKGKTIGFVQFENPTVNGQKIQNEFDWMLHVTSDDEWTEDVTISAYIYRVIVGGYFTDMEVYHNVTKNNPWVETFSTPNHSYTATYKVPNFDKTNWDAGHNYLRGNDRNNGLAKYAPAIQTSDQTPLNTLVNSGGKKAPSDAKLSGYKFVTKISGLGLPTHFSSTSREMHILVVDQNGRVTNEDLAFYSSAGDWNPYKAKVSDWHIKEVENNLTAQQLYDRVKNNETLVSRQNDGTILIANGVGVDALEMTDDFITNYVKNSSVQYAIANATDRQKILDNTLAFYHGPLKNTAASAFVHNFMSNDDPNGIVDRKIEDVTPSASGRQNAGPIYQRYHLYDSSGKGDLLQHEYVYYIDADAGNTVFKKDDLAGKAGEKKDVVVNTPTGYILDQKLTGSIPTSYTLKDGSNEPIKVYFRHIIDTGIDKPRDRDGLRESDLNKTITRTIKVTNPDGKVNTTPQTVKLTRTATLDEATGKITYSDWTTGQFDAFQVPGIKGYTPSQPQVDQMAVTVDTKDQTVEVTYTANPQSTKVNYVDPDGTPVHSTPITGHTDETVKVPDETPAGWHVVNKGDLPGEITFTAEGHPEVNVPIEHSHTTVTPDDPKTPSDKLPDNPDKTYPEGVGQDDLNKTITRTIKVTDPAGKKSTTEQKVHLTRTADVDEVTGEVTYGDWTTGNFEVFEVPGVDGYTPSQAKVDEETVTADTKDQTVEVTYTANPQSTKVNYVDPDGKQVHSTPITGHTDETVKIPNEVPSGWHVVNKDDLPSELTFTPEGHPEINVPIEHSHTTVTPDDPKTPSDKLPDNPDKSYPEGVGQDDLNKTITRTIVVTDPAGKKSTTEQKVHLTRTADVDEVTGEVTYGDWTTGKFEDFEVPAVKGYTPSQAKVDEETVTADTKDQTVEVTYTANPQSTKVNYVDPDGKQVHSTPITGHTDETVKVPDETPAGWHVVNEGDLPGELTFTPDGHPEVNVPIEHSHTTVTPDSPKTPNDKLPDNPDKNYPEGVGQDDLNKTITRAIKVTDPHTKQVQTTTQKVHLTRTADVDEVTGEVTYGDWTTGSFEAFEVPAVDGYTPSQAKVDEETVTAGTKDQTVEVTYTANPQSTKVNYVDLEGKPVHSTPITGHTDETVKVPDETPAGWHIINKDDLPGELTFTPDGHPEVNVKIEHSHTTVTPDDPKTPNDKLPDNPDKNYPEGVGQDDLNKTITRTINFHLPSGKVVPGVQKVQLTRTADVDEVTGEVTYGDWSEGKFNAFDVPSVKGYTPSQPKIEEMKVTSDTKDQVIDVTYSADPQSTKVNYVDPDGKPVHSTPVTGHTDETVKVPDETPAGWHVVNKDDLPGELTFTAEGHPEINVPIEHSHTTVTPDDPKTPSDKLPDNPDKNYPEGVGQDDLNKTVTRKIVVTNPDGTKDTTEQKVHLTRQADVDEVTGEVTYGDWTTGSFEAFEVPAVDGYTPSQAKVDEETVTADTKDQTVEVTYTANAQGTKINYVDPNGEIIHSTPVTGHTNETVKVPDETPAGWHIVNKGDLPGEVTFTSDGHPEVNVKIEHSHTTVTPDDPKTPNDKLPDNPDKNYPEGVGQDDLNRTVTRTIVVTNPDGTKDTTEQKVHLTRQADVDEVTGEVTYSDWTTGEFEAFEVPAIKGYTPSQAQVDEQTVTADTQNQTVEITYTANEQTIKITYVDEDGNVVHTTTVTGHTDETVEVPNELPNGWHIVDGDLPKTITFSADGNQDITIKIAKDQAPVVPTQKPTMTATAMTPEQMVDQVVKKVNAEEAAKVASLPQTGDKSDETTALIGASLAGVGALLGLVGTRRKKED